VGWAQIYLSLPPWPSNLPELEEEYTVGLQ